MNKEIELLMRKTTLQDLELWLYAQYREIDEELNKLKEQENE